MALRSRGFRWRWPGGWGRSVLSVLLGNLIYHAVEDDLPEAIRHQPFALDWGLLLDFAICAALLGLSFLIVPVSRSK